MYDHFVPAPVPDAGVLATLLDVTLRDGGFEVDFRWPAHQFETVTEALAPLGVEIVELGYLGGVPLDHAVSRPGCAADLTPDLVAGARRDDTRLAAMIHTSALREPIDLKGFATAGLDLVRLVYHPDWLDDICRAADQARRAGLTVSVNIALASRYRAGELADHAARINALVAPDMIYVADTCGALQPADVTLLVGALARITRAVGFHPHDFLSLGYANALAAVVAGATYVDVSILGLGRGGGNLAAETVLVRHRLARQHTPTPDLIRFLTCRSGLGKQANRHLPSLVPLVCGAGNYTPVEESDLLAFATDRGIDPDLAALWTISGGCRAVSRQRDALATTWDRETTP